MKGLSAKEMEIVSHLEFEKKYFFTREDVSDFFTTNNQQRHRFHKLLQKERIVKLNKDKYYLIPVRAKTGKWAEDSFVIIDEVMNGEDYFIGGWAAANYWGLTEQVSARIEVYTTKRQGIKQYLTTTIIFKRTTKERLKSAVTEFVHQHTVQILNKEECKKWLTSKE